MSPRNSPKSDVDVELEAAAFEVEQVIEAVRQQPDDGNVSDLARRMQLLNLAVSRILPRYGEGYEERGRKFIDIGLRAHQAAFSVPERITRTDPGADRSAQALICRSALEIAASVHEHCAFAMQNVREKL